MATPNENGNDNGNGDDGDNGEDKGFALEDLTKLMVDEQFDYAAFIELIGDKGMEALSDTETIKTLLQSTGDKARQDVHKKHVRGLKKELRDLKAQVAKAAKTAKKDKAKLDDKDTKPKADAADDTDWGEIVADKDAKLLTNDLIIEGLRVDNLLREKLYALLERADASQAFKYVRPLVNVIPDINTEERELMEPEEYLLAWNQHVTKSIDDEVKSYMEAFEVEPKPLGTSVVAKSKGKSKGGTEVSAADKSVLQRMFPALATQY